MKPESLDLQELPHTVPSPRDPASTGESPDSFVGQWGAKQAGSRVSKHPGTSLQGSNNSKGSVTTGISNGTQGSSSQARRTASLSPPYVVRSRGCSGTRAASALGALLEDGSRHAGPQFPDPTARGRAKPAGRERLPEIPARVRQP